jgi:hypothetical protein
MKVAVLLCCCALIIAASATAQTADIAGTWTVNATMDSGPVPPSTLTLKRDGTKMSGVLSGQHGDIPVEASVKDNDVTIWFTIPAQEGPTAITMKGTLSGDAIKGTADLGGGAQASWTATRTAAVPAPARSADTAVDVTGTWLMVVETGARSGTPTIVLKQDGEKLTGRYTGQLGEAAVTGTIKGAALNFGFDVTVRETALHVTYDGSADASGMKGAVKLGDFGEGTFTGKKK